MRKILFPLLASVILLTMSCENEPLETENTPENVFTNKTWEYKSYNGDILQVYKKISFTKNEFSVYLKTDNANTVSPGIYEETINGTYSLFYEEEQNPITELGLMYIPSIKFISDNENINGTVTWTFYDDYLYFINQSGDCSLITTQNIQTTYNRFSIVN